MTSRLNVAIVGGAGRMGSRIGADFALHGHNVNLYDTDENRLQVASSKIGEMYDELVRDGFYSSADTRKAMSRIRLFTELSEALADVDFVSECIFENLEVKRNIFAELSEQCPSTTVLSTNTMNFSVTEIAEDCAHPERILGVRFLHPVLVIEQVELTTGVLTSKTTIDEVKSMLLAMGKAPFFKAPGQGNHAILSDLDVQRQRADFLRQKSSQPANRKPSHGLSTASVDTASSSTSQNDVPVPREPSDDPNACCICFANPKNCLIAPCGHLCVCEDCAKQVFKANRKCPMCRGVMERYYRAYT